MVNILLGILKVIGILLAVVLSLILLLIMILLLGPVGYRASGRYREEKSFSAGVSWIGFVLRANADYKEEAGILWGVRLFGILIASNDEEFIRIKEEKRQRKEEKKRKKALKQETEIHSPHLEELKLPESAEPSESAVLPEPAELPESSELPQTMELPKTESFSADEKEQQSLAQSISVGTKESEKTKKKASVTIKENAAKLYSKIKQFIQMITSIPDKIRALITRIKAKIDHIKAKIARIIEIKEFFLGERHREAFQHIWKNIKKMIRHILPRKLEGNVEFGVEDPYVMGQILTVLSIFYPLYQDKFSVIPDFENPGFAGDASLKGRIIPGYLVLRLLIAICNRKVIRLIKEGIQQLPNHAEAQ